MRRVKSTFETVPSEGGGRLGDVESSRCWVVVMLLSPSSS
jgi:hypothetical protein